MFDRGAGGDRVRAIVLRDQATPPQLAAPSFQCLLLAVVSTGRRNTLAKSLCWRLEVQRFSGPLVEQASHPVQLGLGVRGEIKALGEVLAQQTIGIFA